MCTTCGCSDHQNDHHHHHEISDTVTQKLEVDILDENKRNAMYNRGWLSAKGIFALNLVSSPGSGKTSLLEATIKRLKDRISIAVIEGDQQTSNDADRIVAQGVKAVQINTQSGCHLDAHMVTHAITDINPDANSVLFIENVGNLVCPAMFDLGESRRVVMVSVTEGDDKPLKYPYMFAQSDVCVINKIDLLPYLPADIDVLKQNILRVNPHINIFELSAYTGEGIDKWCNYILSNGVATDSHHDNYFDKMASKWDTLMHHNESKISFLLSKIKIKNGDLILDVGTGTGVLIPFLLTRVGAKGSITAVDSSAKMIEIAKKKHKGIRNVMFNVADIEGDAIEGIYNHIILYSVYPHLQHQADTITNLVNNNLAPNGNLMIAHSQSKESINNVHKNIPSLPLPAVKELIKIFEQRGLQIIEHADTAEHYYLILGKKGQNQ